MFGIASPNLCRLKGALAATTLVLLAACGGGGDEAPAVVQVRPVSLEGIGHVPQGTYVFRTRAEWLNEDLGS